MSYKMFTHFDLFKSKLTPWYVAKWMDWYFFPFYLQAHLQERMANYLSQALNRKA